MEEIEGEMMEGSNLDIDKIEGGPSLGRAEMHRRREQANCKGGLVKYTDYWRKESGVE
ncbi:hypothetical protein L484_019133 [Morus notabilis]|uniref:Uncharacterized protein n=1 Tax=Morus notabilis TaxID=981085 RepID=W9SBJ3_9ROSA|nr:hypothetical protein L484_019133 [Morus notabilis]